MSPRINIKLYTAKLAIIYFIYQCLHFNLSFLAFEILVRQILFDKTPRHHRFLRIWIGCEFRKQISYILCKNTLHDRDLNH